MSSFGAPLLFAAVALVLIMLGAVWFMNRVAGALVGSRHRVLQEIVETGQVPSEWSRGYRRKLARLEKRGEPDDVALLSTRAQQDYLGRLDQLIRYAQTTPLVDDEDTREMLLRRLAGVRAEWQKKT